jgi:type I restriction enzyme S subunit
MTKIETTNGTEIYLPAGWRWVRLGDVCEFLDHRRKPVSEAERAKRNEGKGKAELYPYYGANGLAGWIDDYLFDEPLILRGVRVG